MYYQKIGFEDLRVWQLSSALIKEVYQLSKGFPNEELYGITSQLRRSIISVAANIAEGYERYHFKDKIKFYYQARGSLAESKSHILIARNLEYVTETQIDSIISEIETIHKLLNSLIRSQQNQSSSASGRSQYPISSS